METNERFAMYGFNSAVFLVQQSTFVTAFLGFGLLFVMIKVAAVLIGIGVYHMAVHYKKDEKEEDEKAKEK